MSHPNEKRSKKSVFQLTGFRGRLISMIVIAGFACIAIVAFMFYGYVLESYDVILKNSNLPDEIVAERYTELWGMAMAMGGIIVLLVLVVAIWTLYVTHRVAGPAYAFQRVIEEIRAGNRGARLQLRQGDDFQPLAQSFNALMDEMQAKRPPSG